MVEPPRHRPSAKETPLPHFELLMDIEGLSTYIRDTCVCVCASVYKILSIYIYVYIYMILSIRMCIYICVCTVPMYSLNYLCTLDSLPPHFHLLRALHELLCARQADHTGPVWSMTGRGNRENDDQHIISCMFTYIYIYICIHTLHYITLHLHYIYITFTLHLHYITLHYTTLHYITLTLHYITLHYITLH
jgi:hypothetical protein